MRELRSGFSTMTIELTHSVCSTLRITPRFSMSSLEQSGTQQSKGKRSVLLISDSMIKAIGEQKLSKSQSVKKICSRGAKITAIKDQLIPALQHTAYDSVIIHAGTNDLNESQPEDVIKGLTEMTEEAIKIRPSIKVSVSGNIISQRDENANEKIMHINHTMKAVCVSKSWLFIDNARIKGEDLKNKGIHLNGDGVKILASNFVRQALKAKIKAGKHKRKLQKLQYQAMPLREMIETETKGVSPFISGILSIMNAYLISSAKTSSGLALR